MVAIPTSLSLTSMLPEQLVALRSKYVGRVWLLPVSTHGGGVYKMLVRVRVLDVTTHSKYTVAVVEPLEGLGKLRVTIDKLQDDIPTVGQGG